MRINLLAQWNLSKAATVGLVLYRAVAALQRKLAMCQCYLGPGRMAVLGEVTL